jgi:GNAT superfamily N-acetyltransferase
MNIHLMKAEERDAKELLFMQKRAFEPLYLIYEDENSPFLQDIEKMKFRINFDNGSFYKIYCDNTPCGGIFIYLKDENLHYVGIIFVIPEFQGKHIGREAIKKAMQNYPNAKKWGIDFPIDQMKNKKCYESLGFIDTGKKESISDKLTLAFYEKINEGEVYNNDNT